MFVQKVRPKGSDTDKPEVTQWMSSGPLFFPEILSTHTLSWTVVDHKDKSVATLPALPSPWQNELCSLCQEDTQHHSAPDGQLWGQWMWNVYVNSGGKRKVKSTTTYIDRLKWEIILFFHVEVTSMHWSNLANINCWNPMCLWGSFTENHPLAETTWTTQPSLRHEQFWLMHLGKCCCVSSSKLRIYKDVCFIRHGFHVWHKKNKSLL